LIIKESLLFTTQNNSVVDGICDKNADILALLTIYLHDDSY